jgi:molybdopterin synthase catalytic subunit/molybdopterin synthase sulfur carrier subunit
MTCVHLLAFAGVREVLGTVDLEFPVEATTARGLLDAVCERYPKLAPYASSLRVAVNGTYAAWDDPVGPGDEVALIPPVAGG